MADDSIDTPEAKRNEEDYTGAVCLLHRLTNKYPRYEEVLIDADDLDAVSAYQWWLVTTGKMRTTRVSSARNLLLHAFIMKPAPGQSVDHRFHNPLDNRRGKMRVGSVRDNNLNTRGNPNASSRFKGVAWSVKAKKWKVITGTRQQRVYLGSFDNEVEAARIYNEYAKKHFGRVAYLNPV